MAKNKKSNIAKHSDDTILVLLNDTLSSHKGERISLGEIVDKLKDKGLALLIAVLSFPVALPIPTPPGFTTLFGVPLCILTAQLIYRSEHPWLPMWLRNRTIKTETFRSFVDKSKPLFAKISRFLKPRHPSMLTESSERMVGVLAFLCSLSVALPILFGNAVPSAAIFIMALGIMYRDGLSVIIGMIIA
ncbi:MAG: exopolysaccharide biosynthesis protein, partial [Alphaproteobacteria bacterium]